MGVEVSAGMLARGRDLDRRLETAVALLQADSARLPLADRCVDLAFFAYGALPFVADVAAVLAGRRVLRPGGRWVFSVTHPVRCAGAVLPGTVIFSCRRR